MTRKNIMIWESNRGIECIPLNEAGYREIWEAYPDKTQAKRMLTKIRGKFIDQYRAQNENLYEEIMDYFEFYTKNQRSSFGTVKFHKACLELIFQANLKLDSLTDFSEQHKYYLEEYFSKLTCCSSRKIATTMHYIHLLVSYYQKGVDPNLIPSKPKKPNKTRKTKNPDRKAISFIYTYALQELAEFEEAVTKRLNLRKKYQDCPLFTKENLAASLDYYYSCQNKTQYKTLVLVLMGKILNIKDVWCLDQSWIEENKKLGENILKLRKEEELFRFFDCLLTPQYIEQYPSELNAIICAIRTAKKRTSLQNKILDSILPSTNIIYPLLTIFLIQTGVNLESLLNAKRLKVRKTSSLENAGSKDGVFYFSSWKNRARREVSIALKQETQAYHFFNPYREITQPFSAIFGNTYFFARHILNVSRATKLTSQGLNLWLKKIFSKNKIKCMTSRDFRDYYAYVCDREGLGNLEKQLALGHSSKETQKSYETQALKESSFQAMRSLQERCNCQNIIQKALPISLQINQGQNSQIPLSLQCLKCKHLCLFKTNYIAIIFLQQRLEPTHELQPILKDIVQRLGISDEEKKHALHLLRTDSSLVSKITDAIQSQGE